MQRIRDRRRQENVRARGRYLRGLQDYDRQVDKALLFDGPEVIQTPRPQHYPWFVSRDMMLEPNYILQELGALVKASVPDEALLTQIDARLASKDFVNNPFDSHANVSLNLTS